MNADPDRLSALDESFLHLEGPNTPMHVGAVCLFDGAPLRNQRGWLDRERIARHLGARLARVPRFRQKLGFVPFAQGRPLWIDDPHFNLDYHVRFSALPAPGDQESLRALVARLFSQRLDRNHPLWEVDVVDALEGGRVALVWKVHHCLVDGVAGMELAAHLFDADPDPRPSADPEPWKPEAPKSEAIRLLDAWIERAARELEHERTLRAALREPRAARKRLDDVIDGIGALLGKGFAPRTSLNAEIGPHRRLEMAVVDLALVKRIKQRLGGTVNDVVLAAVGGSLRALLVERGEVVDGVRLRTVVPVSVRGAEDAGALGNQVSLLVLELDLGEPDPRRRLAAIAQRTADLKRAHQAEGGGLLATLSAAAPAALIQHASRLQSAQRFVNLVVTNVPGPQFPLYLSGAELLEVFPCVPLAPNLALSVGVLSYHGKLGFGLVGDRTAMPDLAALRGHLSAAFDELERAAAAPPRRKRARKPRR